MYDFLRAENFLLALHLAQINLYDYYLWAWKHQQWQKANYLDSYVMMMTNGAPVYDGEYL